MAQTHVVIFVRSLAIGGVERQMIQIASQLSQLGWRVDVVSIDGGPLRGVLHDMGIRLSILGRPRIGGHLVNVVRFLRVLRQLQPDVVYGLAVLPSAYVTVCSRVERTYRPTYVAGLRATNLESTAASRRTAILASFPRRFGMKSVHVVSNSHAAASVAVAAGHPDSRVSFVPNSIDVDTFRPVNDEMKESIRFEFGYPPDTIVIGNVSRQGSKKGLEDLVAAVGIVQGVLPRVMIAVAGLSPDNDFALSVLSGSRIGGLVTFCGHIDDMSRFYQSLDLFVSSSRFGEGFPNAVGEALCCGVPVVATDTGDSVTIAPDFIRGVPANSPQLLAEAILSVLSANTHDSTAQVDFMRDHYSLDKLGSRTARALRKAMDQDRRLSR